MIKSMTGFGRCENANEKRKFTVEMKSVNHRYFDVNIKMPKKLNFFESAIRNLLKEYIERGKVDVFITYEDYSDDNFSLKYNPTLAGEYLKHVHFARRNDDRKLPQNDQDYADCLKFAQNLKKIGYDERISLEANFAPGFAEDIRSVWKYLTLFQS